MRTLKTLFAVAALTISTVSFAQTTDTTFTVNGVCGMCQRTIENACDIDGVETASWSPETKIIQISFEPSIVSIDEINKAINDSGYDTEFSAAPENAYEGLHGCCKYRDPEVQASH
ncbi:MAG: copper chaperone [Bacteroidetes bacterium]|uniref:Heavy-metal-associated domain-containing protein n=1 Tax=Phaeocystidibacter marisrubri TaxID=1577780 RepID=A0A6L3ZJR1_9FLAO|nr:heavy-metal-associated domain-containing protein [Phaeocystidibacter marisrubri]KAB2817798.1 heavy-metal-associated domain-containing protein [Phaeocystidibacter marisrubri]TNE31220.1 MAG: copper chaperone [Bacteroidota bacterium]GGH73483.1 hypothetical protein GCM10011318_18550 [Phaeocystidibacter marisrubri]